MIQGERKLQTNNNKQDVPFITESHYIIRNDIIGSNNLNWILFVCLFLLKKDVLLYVIIPQTPAPFLLCLLIWRFLTLLILAAKKRSSQSA